MTTETERARARARLQLIENLWPAVLFLQREARIADATQVDFEVSRRLYLEKITGQRADGQLSVFYATLQEGGQESIARLEELLANFSSSLNEIEENPDRLGVSVIDEDVVVEEA